MPAITFYRQARADGGIRTGLDVEGETVLGHYEGPADDDDPALLWYVDVRCDGQTLPTAPEEARCWLLAQSALIRKELTDLAAELSAGIDLGSWPVQRQVAGVPAGVEMTLVCSAVKRLDALEISRVVRDVGTNFDGLVAKLEPIGKLVP